MAGVEVLAGLGLVATELFRYNRENYEFDQDQRFEREELRLKMQVERFKLFREDIRDLVELTTGKMDLYHLVGALFLRMCVIYYCEGFFTIAPPPYLLALYYLSNACSLVYLLLAVWLAMHASISSHSYGTRLLTRFVRLPIPGSSQINILNTRLADFEKQGIHMLRLPFLQKKTNVWRQRSELEGEEPPHPSASSSSRAPPLGAKVSTPARPASGAKEEPSKDLLDSGEFAFGGAKDLTGHEEELLQAVEFSTHRHVQLFRQLQARWQCYDAYARVCMSLGVRQMLQSVSYYLIGVCMVENRAPAAAFVLVFSFQALAMAISVLDIHGLPCYGNLDLSIAGMLPSLLACIALFVAHRDEDGRLRGDNRYLVALAAFPLEVCWFELLHWVASPTSDDDAALPRHFRAVLFMDVFGEVDDPTEADIRTGGRILSTQERTIIEHHVSEAEGALARAQAAFRRWEAVPKGCLSLAQRKQVDQMKRQLRAWVQALHSELERRRLPGLSDEEERLRRWEELSVAERDEDPFADSLVGPFEQCTDGAGLVAQYYYCLESNEYVYDTRGGRAVLPLQEAEQAVKEFIVKVEAVCAAAGDKAAAADEDGESEDNSPTTPLTAARKGLPAGSKVDSKVLPPVTLQPVRLPWRLMSMLTRAVQLVWIGVGIMAVLRTGVLVLDFQESDIHEERRLRALAEAGPRWRFSPVEVDWPMGGFFRPKALACPRSGSSDPLLSSPYATYVMRSEPATSRVHLQELPPEDSPSGWVTFSGPRPDAAHQEEAAHAGLQGMLSEDGLTVSCPRQLSEEVGATATLPFSGRPWRLAAGAVVRCSASVSESKTSSAEPADEQDDPWCLLVAGWAGGGEVHASLVGLRAGGPRAATVLAPHVSLPLLVLDPEEESRRGRASSRSRTSTARPASAHAPVTESRSQKVVSLHVSPTTGRLWLLTAAGTLQAWELLSGEPRHLGRWTPEWPADLGRFEAAAVGEACDGSGVWLAGRAGPTEGAGGPALLWAPGPFVGPLAQSGAGRD